LYSQKDVLGKLWHIARSGGKVLYVKYLHGFHPEVWLFCVVSLNSGFSRSDGQIGLSKTASVSQTTGLREEVLAGKS
jgi:hypothetical protein